MDKIVIIGAGHGGMQAAKVLAESGRDVTVYEKSSIDKLSRDRWDTIDPSVFDELNIPVPEGSFRDSACAFTAPFSDKPLILGFEPDKRDWTVDRRVLAPQLVKAAEEKGAKFIFNTEVEGLITDNRGAKGIIVNGEKIFADLVIDASGVYSPFRASLPKRCDITAQPDDEDVFSTWDALFDCAEGVELPENYGFLMRLKYTGKKCVAWCVPEFGDKFAAFIGKAGGMTKEEFEEILAQLRKDHPFMGTNKLRGGDFANIPIRRPLSKMIADGYAAVGDSAFMTIPLVGCGVANSLRAGQLLGEAIVKADSVNIEALWNYQVSYYKKIGASNCFIDMLKRFLLNCDNDEIKKFFESGIISNEEIKNILSGKLTLISVKELAERIGRAYKSKDFFGGLAGAAVKGVKAMTTALAIPKKYDIIKIAQWQQKIETVFER